MRIGIYLCPRLAFPPAACPGLEVPLQLLAQVLGTSLKSKTRASCNKQYSGITIKSVKEMSMAWLRWT